MPELLLSLISFALIATISPGGATTLATASGAQFGFLRSIPLMSGIALGLGALVGAVAAGLGAVTRSWPQLDLWLRIVGTVYMLWLAWTIGRQAAPGQRSGATAVPFGFVAGVMLLWANPKAWTMAAATASAYASLSHSPLLLAVTTGIVFACTASVSLTLWCSGGAWLRRLLKTDTQWRMVNIVLAALLAASVALMWR